MITTMLNTNRLRACGVAFGDLKVADVSGDTTPTISVVIPTADRPEQLREVLTSLVTRVGATRCEVVVVDDGRIPLDWDVAQIVPEARVIRAGRQGPAHARNIGWSHSAGEVIFFADDDVLLETGWLEKGIDHFRDPSVVGVEGRVVSEPWDKLYEEGVSASVPGAGLTCNIAYRRSVLEALDGFYEGFPYPHCEDVDLRLRASGMGKIVFEPSMVVEHPTRAMSLSRLALRGRWSQSQVLLEKRHPGTFPRPAYIPARVLPLWTALMSWLYIARDEGARLFWRPRRAARLVLLVTTHLLSIAITLASSGRRGCGACR
jgi:GT2 family glycosyltransferase